MAAEIKVTAQIQCTNGSFTLPKIGDSNGSIDQVASGGAMQTITTSTVDTAFSFPTITNLGRVYLKNIDTNPANTIKIGPDNAGAIKPCLTVTPGEPAQLLRFIPGVTYRWKADAGTPKLQIIVLEN